MAKLAVYEFNDYILNGTDVGSLLGYDGTGLRPIVPLQQQPELNADNPKHPYIVYSWRTSMPDDAWWLHTDEVSYVIWGKNLAELSEVATEILNTCRALDESAEEAMKYFNSRQTESSVDFKYVRVMGSFSPEAPTSEGGRLGWLITIRYVYTPNAGKHIN